MTLLMILHQILNRKWYTVLRFLRSLQLMMC